MAQADRPVNDAGRISDMTVRRLSVCYAAALLVLLAVTWRLWLGTAGFPQAPAFAALASVPTAVDLPLLAGFQGAALAAAAVTRRLRLFWIIQSLFVLVSFALNQHRLQVWAYHLCIAGLIAEFSSAGRALPRLRWLTISIYAWSAVSKLDAGFATGPGATLLGGLLSALHVPPPDPGLGKLLPWAMPIGELTAALALAIPAARRMGLVLSILMHLLLLLAVGPFGLNHEFGVQFWNGLFLIQNVLLFGTAAAGEQGARVEPSRLRTDFPIRALLAAVVLMPAAQPWGYWDVWPSWAVYSTRGGWTTSFIHRDEVTRLPEAARPFIRQPPPLSDWHPIDVDAWSLSELHCPVYPQPRFRLAVAAGLSRYATVRVERRSPPHRRTGATVVQTIEVTNGRLPPDVAKEFWLNVAPRR